MNERKQHIMKFLDSGMRFDSRKTDEYRSIVVDESPNKNAEGFARVKIGETDVMVGVKLAIDKPYPDKPNEGTMMVGAELSPLASPEFESGPPGNEAVELARVVDRGIRESNSIDQKKLCIEEGEKCWLVFVDIAPLNDDGNLFDAAALAAAVALKNARFPKVEDGKVNYRELTEKKLPLSKLPVSVTVHKLGNHLLVDPTPEEEEAADARLTVAVIDGKLCAMQKGGEEAITTEETEKMVDLAIRKSKELLKYI